MRKLHPSIWIALALGIPFGPPALAAHGSALKAEITKILDASGKKSAFSLRGPDGREVINVRGQTPLTPASIAKSISTGCSLLELGPAFQFNTTFGFTGKIERDRLKGNLVVRGEGDPAFVIEDLREVIEKLRVVYGIRAIDGRLDFDVSYMGKENLPMSEGFEGDNGRSFASDLTPLPLNQNSFSIWTAPTRRGDGKTMVASLPAGTVPVELANHTKLGSSSAVSVSYDPAAGKASIAGTVSEDDGPKGVWRAVPDNYRYYATLIRKVWLDSGGEWASSEFKISPAKIDFTELWKNPSRPLGKILMDINKLSLNLGAELTLLAAGVKKSGPPASYPKALSVIDKCLKDLGVPASGIHMTNASGLSRETRIETSALSQFLAAMANSVYAPEYLASFSLLGIDGTAKTRLTSFAGRGRIKTGSIAGVSSIAGYLTGRDGQRMSFALIMNGVDQSNPKVKQTQDRILEKVLKQD